MGTATCTPDHTRTCSWDAFLIPYSLFLIPYRTRFSWKGGSKKSDTCEEAEAGKARQGACIQISIPIPIAAILLVEAAATQQSAHQHEGPHVFPDKDLNIPDEVNI